MTCTTCGGAWWGKGGAGHAPWAACWTWRHAGPQRWVCGSGICLQQQALMPASCLECSRQAALLAAANDTAVLVERHRLLARLIPSTLGAGTWLWAGGVVDLKAQELMHSVAAAPRCVCCRVWWQKHCCTQVCLSLRRICPADGLGASRKLEGRLPCGLFTVEFDF